MRFSFHRKEVITIYSPAIDPEHIRPLYRLARVRGIPMTKIINSLVMMELRSAEDEIEQYDPKIHDRNARRRSETHSE